MFKRIETNTKYLDFLRDLDYNYENLHKELDDIWQVFIDNDFIEPSGRPMVRFKPLFKTKDDSTIYKNLLSNNDRAQTLINHLIESQFNFNGIFNSTTYEEFQDLILDLPETIVFDKNYIEEVNTGWQKVAKLISDLNASLIFFHYLRKENK